MSLDPFGHPEQPGAAAAVKFEERGSGWLVGDVEVQAGRCRLRPFTVPVASEAEL